MKRLIQLMTMLTACLSVTILAAGCATAIATTDFGGKGSKPNPAVYLVTVPIDIVTAPVQAVALSGMALSRKLGEPERKRRQAALEQDLKILRQHVSTLSTEPLRAVKGDYLSNDSGSYEYRALSELMQCNIENKYPRELYDYLHSNTDLKREPLEVADLDHSQPPLSN